MNVICWRAKGKTKMREVNELTIFPLCFVNSRPHIGASDLGNLLKFIYDGEIKINKRSLKSFLAVAKLLRIKGMDFELNEVPKYLIHMLPHPFCPILHIYKACYIYFVFIGSRNQYPPCLCSKLIHQFTNSFTVQPQ